MKTRTAAEIRESFLRFFEERGHRRVKSSSLVPQDDPTLLFTNAGMVQFKDVFTGRERRDYARATTSQKCVRAGGKHNDLENVGFTARHHTFFEMLGNFSFGDYFKKDAVAWAWEWVTSPEWLGIPKDRLAATVFAGEGNLPWDEEAFELWKAQGVPPDRIHRLGAKDNFWAMGETGPCGPCSEIHFFQGNDVPCAEEQAGRPCLGVACDCDRWLEIWNLVFMQFERSADGGLTPLPRPSIDTGAGLERVAAVVQGKRSNYETDLFQNVIAAIEAIAGKRQATSSADDQVSMRVIADHARATTFLVGDGVLPSNEGRGYVLRRIMRRAIRHGKRLGLERPFLADVCRAVVAEMGDAYPEARENEPFIAKVAQQEEESFRRTLDRGLALLDEEIRRLGRTGERTIPGRMAFQLYDTFGFPMDLTRVIAAEHGLGVDEPGFDRHMAEQRARSEWKGSGDAAVGDLHKQIAAELGDSKFLGYEAPRARAEVKALLANGARVARASKGDRVEVVTDATPFYGEAGGQVGDHGSIASPAGKVAVRDAVKPAGVTVHRGEVVEGEIAVGDVVELEVDDARRDLVRANHSATHLLHFALRERLGEHVKQAGSVVAPDHLRFDFSHFAPLTRDELRDVERRVNELVRANEATDTAVLELEQARKAGAMMIFGEKYGDRVRVVRLGPSKELCGGTHVRRAGDIAFFKIGSEESIAAGVRRIVAYTGPKAVEVAQRQEEELERAAGLLKSNVLEVAQKVEAAQRRMKELERALEEAQARVAAAQSGDLASRAREVNGVKVLAARVQGDGRSLRDLADRLRDRLGRGVVALGAEQDGKALLLVAVTKDLAGRVKAGDLVKEAAKLVGGSGGGRPDLAQAGGSNPAGLEQALAKVEELVSSAVA
jgi:alanyl-tRNA synthetase